MESLYNPNDVIADKYRVIGILGQGGTATTYEVEDIDRQITVAIKVLSLKQATDWKVVELFAREAKALANLKHPRIPKYIDYFDIESDRDKRFFLVQELIPGNSLAKLVTEGWYFQEEEVKEIAISILEILNYLHNLNPTVIHRDIKPQNIIKTDTGEIYLVDFGAVQDVYRNTLTRGGTFVGTIDYMSPEHLRGQVTYASDLYSLGCTLLFLLTRKSPLELPLKKMKLNFHNEVSISLDFANWLDKLIQPVPEDRFASTKKALQELKELNIIQGEISESDREQLEKDCITISQIDNKLTIDIIQDKNFRFKIISSTILLAFSVFYISVPSITLIQKTTAHFKNYIFVDISVIAFILIFLVCLFQLWIIYLLLPKIMIIEIDREFFTIRKVSRIFKHQLSRIIKHQIKGKTKDIRKVETKKYHSDGLYHCLIWQGVKQHKFGNKLSKRVQEILVREINDFLEKIQPRD